MKVWLALLVAALTAMVACKREKPIPAGAQNAIFRDGDRIVLWSDSTAFMQPWARTLELYLHTAHPDWSISFTNLAWGGDTASNLDRMKRDLELVPDATLVIILLGMNDAGYGPYDEALFDAHVRGLRELVSHVQSRGARAVIATPTRFEADRFPVHITGRDVSDYPQTVARFAAGAKEVAREMGVPFLDTNAGYTEAEARWKAAMPDLVLTFDGPHPKVEGYILLAWQFLKLVGADFLLGEETLDWKSRQVVRDGSSQTAESTNKYGMARMRWTRRPARLPWFYSDGEHAQLPLALLREVAPLDLLRVENLPTSHGLVLADGRPIGVYSREDLAVGVNLAIDPQSAPGAERAKILLGLIREKEAAFNELWRSELLPHVIHVQDASRFRHETPRTESLRARVAVLQSQIESIKRPEPIVMELLASDVVEPPGVNGDWLVPSGTHGTAGP